MDLAEEELYSLLIPLSQHRLIVPRVCVAEVVRHVIEPAPEDAPDWLRGQLRWNDRALPVVSFERMAGLPCAEPGGRTRIAVFNAMSGQLESRAFGLLTEGFPQLVRVNRDVMETDTRHAWPDDGPIICQIRMINEYPLIPDLEQVEGMIAAGETSAETEPA